jgi:hypothetical protein
MFLEGRGELELGSIPIARSGTVAYERFKRYARQCGKVRKRPGCLHTVKLQGVPTVRIQSMPATGDQQLIDWFSFSGSGRSSLAAGTSGELGKPLCLQARKPFLKCCR